MLGTYFEAIRVFHSAVRPVKCRVWESAVCECWKISGGTLIKTYTVNLNHDRWSRNGTRPLVPSFVYSFARTTWSCLHVPWNLVASHGSWTNCVVSRELRVLLIPKWVSRVRKSRECRIQCRTVNVRRNALISARDDEPQIRAGLLLVRWCNGIRPCLLRFESAGLKIENRRSGSWASEFRYFEQYIAIWF